MDHDMYLSVLAAISVDLSKFELSPEFATKEEELMDIIGKPMPNAENPELVYKFLNADRYNGHKYAFPTGENGPLLLKIYHNNSTSKYTIHISGCLKNCYIYEDPQEITEWFVNCVDIIGTSAIDHACISVTDNDFWTMVASTSHKQNKEPCLYSDDRFVWVSTTMM